MTWTVCVGLTVLLATNWSHCPACHFTALSCEVPFLSQLISPPVRGLPGVWELLLFFSSLTRVQVPSCFLFFFFPFILPSYLEIFLVFSDVWGLLLVFSRFSVRIIPHIDAFLMYLWEEESSTSYYCTILIGVPFFFLATCMPCEVSQARDQTWSTAMAMPILNLLGHPRIPPPFFFERMSSFII